MNRPLLFFLATFAISLLKLPASEPPLNDFEDETAQWEKRLEQRQKAWRSEKEPALKQKRGDEVKEAAIRCSDIPAVEELLAGGPPDKSRVRIPEKSSRVSVQILHEFPIEADPTSWPFPFVVRRMTADRLELWSDEKGWLFDVQGKILNTAQVPRKDGHGREWFGAFLPDGRWITTDLWERDDSIHFFSAAGKFNKSIKAESYLPKLGENEYQLSAPGLVGWARSAKDGKSWIVSIGSEYTVGTFKVTPDYKGRMMDEGEPDLWQVTWPRDMGSRGMAVSSSNVSDDNNATLYREEAGHGWRVGFPDFIINRGAKKSADFCIPEAGQNFGFWPGSYQVWVGNNKYLLPPNPSAEEGGFKTWFFSKEGKTLGWIAAERINDAPDGKGMWFAARDGRVIELGSDLEVKAVRAFANKEGSALFPHKLYADLKLGFFYHEGKVVIGRW